MPFIGKDWRSPGEQWVKTEKGSWERIKILYFNSNHNHHYDKNAFHSSGESSSSDSDSENECNLNNDSEKVDEHLSANVAGYTDLKDGLNVDTDKNGNTIKQKSAHDGGNHRNLNWPPPYCHITLKSTREVAGYNRISEAFYKLDFCNAIQDVRRFNYICKLLHLLITQNLTSLSGCATRLLFALLERVAWQVASNQQNIHILHTLLYDLKKIMKKYYCWGRPLGSTLVWNEHFRTIEKICEMANNIETQTPDNGQTKLTDLPEELIKEILLRLRDYRDLINSGKAYPVMHSLLEEQTIWKQLCKYHFTKLQIKQAPSNYIKENGITDWEKVFHFLRRKFGLKEEYAESLFLCRHCRCLFWKSFGHPCIFQKDATSETSTTTTSDENSNHVLTSRELPARQQRENASPPEQRQQPLTVPEHIPVSPESFLKFFSL